MAGSFTDYLDGPNQGEGVVRPSSTYSAPQLNVPGGSGIFSQLADVGSKLFSGAMQNAEYSDRQASKKAVNSAISLGLENQYSKELSLREASNNLYSNDDIDPNTGGFRSTVSDPMSLVGSDVHAAIGDLNKAKTAVQQGRFSQAGFDIKFEDQIMRLVRSNPDNVQNIYSALQSSGFNHYLFREAAAQETLDTAKTTAAAEMHKDYLDAARKAGVPENLSDDEKAAAGRQAIEHDRQVRESQQQLEIAMKINAEKRADRAEARADRGEARADRGEVRAESQYQHTVGEQARETAERNLFNAVSNRADQIVSGGLSLMSQGYSAAAAQAALGDTKALDTFRIEVGRQVNNSSVALEGYFATQGANLSPERKAALRATAARLKEGMATILGGDIAAETARVTNIQNKFKLNAMEALPFYMTMRQALGNSPALDAQLESLSPETRARISSELKGINPESIEGRLHMNTAIQLTKGQLKISDLDEGKAAKQMPGLIETVKRTGKAIMNGDSDPNTQQHFMGSAQQVTIAAGALRPGTSNFNATKSAMQALTGPEVIAGLNGMNRTPATASAAGDLMTANRAATANVLNVAKGFAAQNPVSDNQLQGIMYKNGRYSVNFNPDVYAKMASKGGTVIPTEGGAVPLGIQSLEEMRRHPDKRLQDTVNTLNAGVDHLVQTAQFDKEVPKNITELQLRDHYVRNTPFPGEVERKQGQGALDSLIKQNVDYFTNLPTRLAEASKQEATSGNVEELRSAAAVKYNIPDAISKKLVRQESGGNQGAVSGKGARGVMQLMPGTAADLGVDPFSLEGNIEGGHKYLGQLLTKYNGNMKLALAAYNAGPGAVDHYGGVPPYAETQNYVRSILGKDFGE